MVRGIREVKRFHEQDAHGQPIPLVDARMDGWVGGWTDIIRHLILVIVISKKGIVIVCANDEITSTNGVANIAFLFLGKKQPAD